MQVFMPFVDFRESLSALDDKRLLKQLVEARQIIMGQGFTVHPATLAWKPFENTLRYYVEVGAEIWRQRGITNRGRAYTWNWDPQAGEYVDMPPFIGFAPYHISHACNLIRKNPGHYTVPLSTVIPEAMARAGVEVDKVPYLWPVWLNDEIVYQVGTGRRAPRVTAQALIDSDWAWAKGGL